MIYNYIVTWVLKTNEIQFCKDVVVDQGDGPIDVMGGVCIDRTAFKLL